MTNIDELRDVIRKLHGVDAKHIESVPVNESFEGQPVWSGVVEVFELKGHPNARLVYAWTHDTDDPKKSRQHITVLNVPPVTSPKRAVRAAILQEFRNRGKSEKG